MLYQVIVTECVRSFAIVEAENLREASERAEELYRLDSDNFDKEDDPDVDAVVIRDVTQGEAANLKHRVHLLEGHPQDDDRDHTQESRDAAAECDAEQELNQPQSQPTWKTSPQS